MALWVIFRYLKNSHVSRDIHLKSITSYLRSKAKLKRVWISFSWEHSATCCCSDIPLQWMCMGFVTFLEVLPNLSSNSRFGVWWPRVGFFLVEKKIWRLWREKKKELQFVRVQFQAFHTIWKGTCQTFTSKTSLFLYVIIIYI